MIIHVVKPGDTLYGIGELYNIDYQKIASDNQIPINQPLVVGETLVILTNNQKKIGTLEVNGFAFPNISSEILKQALPSLTYLSIFSYAINYNGSLTPIDDDPLIDLAVENNIFPIMVISNTNMEGRFDSDLVEYILESEEAQDQLIRNVINTMNIKGYKGLDIDFEYIYPKDHDQYINFISKVKYYIKRYDYLLLVALAPKTSSEQQGLLYEAHDYQQIGSLADRVIIMTYEWGFAGGPPLAVAPINLVERVIKYAVSVIPANKILMGIPNYGYDWILPYISGTIATSISNYDAVNLAYNFHQSISYDNRSQTPYFYYSDENNVRHIVWFEDARSIEAKLKLVKQYNLVGISYWTLNRLFPQNFLVLNAMYNIKKQ